MDHLGGCGQRSQEERAEHVGVAYLMGNATSIADITQDRHDLSTIILYCICTQPVHPETTSTPRDNHYTQTQPVYPDTNCTPRHNLYTQTQLRTIVTGYIFG